MDADIEGAYENLEKSWRVFEHRGKPMTKNQVRQVLLHGIKKGYESTSEFTDEEIDQIIKS